MNQSQAKAEPRILIVRTGAMGDILHGMPAVAMLRKQWPNAEIGWVVEPHWSPLLRASDGSMPLIDHLFFASTRDWGKKPLALATLKSILALRRELRVQRYDFAIDLQGSIRSAVIAKMSGAKRILGPADPRESQARWFYDFKVATTAEHVIDQAREMTFAAGADMNAADTLLPIDPEAETWAEENVPANAVLIAPSAGWGAKQWPAARYGEVAHALAQNGYSVLVNAMSVNDPLAQTVVATADHKLARPVEASIAQLIALTRRVKLVIAGDTGPLHLAAALKVPVVAIFGPTDPDRNGPYGTRSRVLRDDISVRDHRRHKEPEAGLLRIQSSEVTQAALDLLREANA